LLRYDKNHITTKKQKMKNLLTILLSFFLITAHAQDGKALKVLGTMTAFAILNGIGDGLNDSNHKTAGHTVNALSYATLIGVTIWSEPERKDWLRYLVVGAGMRYVVFDASYNITRGLPYDYIGTTAGSDRLLKGVPSGYRTFTKGIVLCGTVGFTFNEFSYSKSYRRNKTFR
jgi:hypothetical protein